MIGPGFYDVSIQDKMLQKPCNTIFVSTSYYNKLYLYREKVLKVLIKKFPPIILIKIIAKNAKKGKNSLT